MRTEHGGYFMVSLKLSSILGWTKKSQDFSSLRLRPLKAAISASLILSTVASGREVSFSIGLQAP